MTTSDEWIRTRTGIEERHFAEAGVSCSDLAFEASRRALEDAGIEAKDLDFIILNTTAASIPLLLDETYRAGRLQRGDLPLLLAFGSDFTWGSALVRW
jgi:3-oxoacyl-[acyl-carrier-protein] synthase III